MLAGLGCQSREFGLVEGGDDEQDGIGAMRSRLQNLKFIHDKIFSQTGDSGAFGGQAQIVERALKELRLSEHGKRSSTAFLKFPGERGYVEFGSNQAF